MKSIIVNIFIIILGFSLGVILNLFHVSIYFNYLIILTVAVFGKVYINNKFPNKNNKLIEEKVDEKQKKYGDEKIINSSINLADSSKNMYLSTNEINDLSERIFESSKKVLALVETDSKSISAIDDEVNKINSKVEHINKIAKEAGDISNDNISIVIKQKNMINSANESIKELIEFYENSLNISNNLNNSSQEIYSITSYIKEIANKTNLLSLNASIEAARAGEGGKGFSVLAGEIKKLAEQSKDFSSNISKRVKVMEDDIQQLTNMTEVTEGKIHVIDDALENIDDALLKIINSSETLDKRIDNILKESISINNSINAVDEKKEFLIEFHNQTYASIQQTASDIDIQWKIIQNFKNITNKISEVTNDFLNMNIDEKVYKTLYSIGIKVMNSNPVKDESSLKKFCRDLGINDIYYSNENGVFEYCSTKEACGLNIFEMDKRYKEFVNSNKEVEIYPLTRRLDTGELYIFMAIKRTDSLGVISVGISINNLLKL